MTTDTIQEAFERVANASPGNTAVDWAGRDPLCYAELQGRVKRLAAGLAASGAVPGSLVLVITRDPADTIAAILAVLYVGAAFVPLDPALPTPRLRAMMRVALPQFVLSASDQLEKVAEILPQDCRPPLLVIDSNSPIVTVPRGFDIPQIPESGDAVPVPVRGDTLCYVYFTSGSTGEPKGIAGRTKSVSHFCNWEVRNFDVRPGDKVSQITNPAYDAYLRDVFTPLSAGAVVSIPPIRDIAAHPRAMVNWIDKEGIKILHTVPSVFRSLLNEDPPANRFQSLSAVLLAGEPLLSSDVRRWFEKYGPPIRLVNLYGSSETTMTKFWYEVKSTDVDRPAVPIGKPMEGARAMVCDAQGLPCAIGVLGEIYIRTPYRTLGYYRRPDLTAAIFITNPASSDPNDLLYRTGDLGRVLEDGNFEFLGRRDRQVKIRGIRVELAEVENALREHGSVRDMVVVDREEESGGKYLCAYVILHPLVDTAELLTFLRLRLPEAMIPSVFIPMDILPRTLSGKIDHSALPVSAQSFSRHAVPFVAAQTPTEEALAAIWSELMQIAPPGIHYNFFTVGGHSLLAMQVIARVEAEVGISLPLQTFLSSPTIHELAQYIETAILEQNSGSAELLDLLASEEEPEGRAVDAKTSSTATD